MHDDFDGGQHRLTDLQDYRRVRQERVDQALIALFAGVLGKPLIDGRVSDRRAKIKV